MEATLAKVHQVKVSQDDEFISYKRLGKGWNETRTSMIKILL